MAFLAPVHHHSTSVFTRFFLSPKPKTLLIFSILSPPRNVTSHSASTSLETLQGISLPEARYASAPHELRTDWDKFTKDYFLNRTTLVSVFLLVDASIPAKKIDLECASWLGQNQVPMTLVFTKCDKRKKKKNGGKHPEENVQDFQELIREYFETIPPWIMTSSVTNEGRDEILLHMSQLRNYWLKH